MYNRIKERLSRRVTSSNNPIVKATYNDAIQIIEHERPKLLHWRDLLQTLAAELNAHNTRKLSDLEVVFISNDGETLRCDVQTALDYISQDIYWNEEYDWSDALIVKVVVL